MNTYTFQKELNRRLRRAAEIGSSFIDINSGDMHRAIGGYPGTSHRMPVCCQVMTSAMGHRDRILQQPPKGKGASLTIRYAIPR